MSTMASLKSDHFDGGRNITKGNRTAATDDLETLLKAARVDIVALEAALVAGYEVVGNITTVNAGDIAVAGVRNTTARGDHQHAVATAAAVEIAPGSVNAEGNSTSLARANHTHLISCAAPAAIVFDAAGAEGVAVTFARSDHVHNVVSPLAPADVTKAAADTGASTTPARADHKHDVSTAATGNIVGANAEGVATSLARSDHTHRLEIVKTVTRQDAYVPAAGNAADLTIIRNAHLMIGFDDGGAALDETILFHGVMPPHFTGATFSVKIYWAAAAAIIGDVKWNVAFEKIELGVLDIDGDSFAAAQTITSTCPGTSGFVAVSTITFTMAQADGIVANDPFRMMLVRHTNDAADTMVGDAQVLAVQIVQ